MPRYGLPKYVQQVPQPPEAVRLSVHGHVTFPLIVLPADLQVLPRQELTRDFHCVTTWTVPGVQWAGWAFRDVWEALLAPVARPGVTHVQFRALDGYRVSVPLEELLRGGVLLADTLNGQPLGVRHGAPLRLVAPQLYGAKNIKHLTALELLTGPPRASLAGRLLIHPRGRVDLEERSGLPPQRFWRWLYAAQLPAFLRHTARLDRTGGG